MSPVQPRRACLPKLVILAALFTNLVSQASAHCRDDLTTPESFGSKYSYMMEMGRGAQGHAIMVLSKRSGQPFTHKVFTRHGGLLLPGFEMIDDVARHEVFALKLMNRFFRSENIAVPTVRPYAFYSFNPWGLTTDSSKGIIDVGRNAPSILLSYVEGREVGSLFYDTRVPIATRLALIERVRHLSDQFQSAIANAFRGKIERNEQFEERESLPDGQGGYVEIDVPENFVWLKGIPGAPAGDGEVMLGFASKNLVLDGSGQLHLIDSI